MKRLIEDIFDIVVLTEGHAPAQLAVALPNDRYRSDSALPQAALPEAGRLASGRGTTLHACRHSCMGEAAEMVSTCAWGDEPLLTASATELGPQALSVCALNGFTDAQLNERDSWNRIYGTYDWRPRPPSAANTISWAPVRNASTGGISYAPADYLYLGRRKAGDDMAVAIADSNGCASHGNAEAAKLGALLELIERDATSRWWYGCRRRPPMMTDQIGAATPLWHEIDTRERLSWLFDITSDIGIPVVAAVSAERDGSDVALGFAAKTSLPAAMEAALTEMLQMEFSLAIAKASEGQNPSWAQWRRAVTTSLPPLDATELPRQTQPAITSRREDATLTDILDTCARLGIDLYFADMSRPSIGVPVYRALSTSLCHYKPRFAHQRLHAHDPRDIESGAERPAALVPLLI
jgi:ribosomal protein S12 methylthiotransferase accessory factor